MAALTMAKDVTDKESWLSTVNKVTDLSLELSTEPPPPEPLLPGTVNPKTGAIIPDEATQLGHHQAGLEEAQAKATAAAGGVQEEPTTGNKPNEQPDVTTPKTAKDLVDLAQDYTSIKGLTTKREFQPEHKQQVLEAVMGLEGSERKMFDSLVAAYTFGSSDPDIVALSGMAHRH